MNVATLPLNEISTEIVNGIACGKANATADGVLHLRPFSVTPDGSLLVSDAPRIPASVIPDGRIGFQVGDILFNNTNSMELVGKSAVFLAPLEASFSNHMTRVRVDNTKADPQYIQVFLHHLYHKRFFESRATRWVGQAAFGTAQLKAIEIPLPPLGEQQRIVGLLDRAAEIRRRADAARVKARTIVPALFLHMFGDPVTNPKGWPVKTLGDLGELDRGRSRHRPRNAPELYGGPYPFVQTGDVANSKGRIRCHGQSYSEAGLAQSRMWPSGTLCITIAANIGKTGVLEFDACFPDSVVGFTPRSEVTSEFIQSSLDFMQAEIEARAPQAAQKNINLQVLRSLAMICPPLAIQREFSERVRHLETLANQIDAAVVQAKILTTALSAKIFS